MRQNEARKRENEHGRRKKSVKANDKMHIIF